MIRYIVIVTGIMIGCVIALMIKLPGKKIRNQISYDATVFHTGFLFPNGHFIEYKVDYDVEERYGELLGFQDMLTDSLVDEGSLYIGERALLHADKYILSKEQIEYIMANMKILNPYQRHNLHILIQKSRLYSMIDKVIL